MMPTVSHIWGKNKTSPLNQNLTCTNCCMVFTWRLVW